VSSRTIRPSPFREAARFIRWRKKLPPRKLSAFGCASLAHLRATPWLASQLARLTVPFRNILQRRRRPAEGPAILVHSTDHMPKPPKTPRPKKPPVMPMRAGQKYAPLVSLSQERLIGRLVVRWSKLEAAMEELIWNLMNVDISVGRIVTARLDTTAKIRMLRQLGELALIETKFHKLSTHLDQIDILREDRNFIVHGTWGTSLPDLEPTASSIRIKSAAPDRVISETFPRERMRAKIDAIDALKRRLFLMVEEREERLGKPPSPRPKD
jgi:hypothetical protein